MKYFLHIAYNGFLFRGWQRQPNAKSVQETIETILERILKQKTICFGCGRTDAQVHADQYFFHIDTSVELQDDFRFILNKNLPSSISCFEIIKVEDKCHARYDVLKRTYDYFLHFEKNPFLAEISALYLDSYIDYKLMANVISYIQENSDFRAFCLNPDKHNHTLCTIFECSLKISDDNKQLWFSITGNRFLKSMIRMLVGKLIDIGKKTFTLEEYVHSLKTGEYPAKLHIARPEGLHLSKIVYPYMERDSMISNRLQALKWHSI
ncbi:MAG: tRNA pseudouridine synthase A [Bacteroidales bacterium]|nr:tRNA pseudouridine synthase A [Bacteroidales bacterium]